MNNLKNKTPNNGLFTKFKEIQEKFLSVVKKNVSSIPNEKIEEIEKKGTIGKALNWQLLGHISELSTLHSNYIAFADFYFEFLLKRKPMRVMWKVDENGSIFYCPIYPVKNNKQDNKMN